MGATYTPENTVRKLRSYIDIIATHIHSFQPSRNGRESPGILGLVPVVSWLSRNLRAPSASASIRLDGRSSLKRV